VKKYRYLIIIILILITGFLIFPSGKLNPVKNVFFKAISPFAIAGNYSIGGVSKFFSNLFSLGGITKQNQALIKENLELQSKLSVLAEAQHENEVLKKELGYVSSQNNLQLLPATIIGRASTGYLSSITIDKGEKDNLKIGQAVVSQGYLVGVVKNVYASTAEITLITDYNSLVPVLLQNSRGTGLLRGGLSGLTVEEIPLNIPIAKDEQVVTSGLGGDIPSGILIGQVSAVVSKEGEIFQKATVNSPIQIYYLKFVFVVR
jgi:rod shape-determining protein MreC